MNRSLLLFLVSFFLSTIPLHARSGGVAPGARSQAMGGAFVSVGDDASSLFLNPAAIVILESLALYGELGEPLGPRGLGQSKISVVLPKRRMAFGAGWYRSGFEDEYVNNLLLISIAGRILEGAQGSFLSLGAGLRLGAISYESTCPGCRASGSTESEITGDLGIVLKPLPVISFGYSLENIREVDDVGLSEGPVLGRVHRWGLSYYWESTVIVSYEQEHVSDRVIHHYGFSLRAAVPFELMAGISDEKVTGGVRWAGDFIRVTVSFRGEGDRGVNTKASIEIFPFRMAEEDSD